MALNPRRLPARGAAGRGATAGRTARRAGDSGRIGRHRKRYGDGAARWSISLQGLKYRIFGHPRFLLRGLADATLVWNLKQAMKVLGEAELGRSLAAA